MRRYNFKSVILLVAFVSLVISLSINILTLGLPNYNKASATYTQSSTSKTQNPSKTCAELKGTCFHEYECDTEGTGAYNAGQLDCSEGEICCVIPKGSIVPTQYPK